MTAQVTEQGIALIKSFEGFRPRAYRDAVGVLTLGHGHTSAAGLPRVEDGMSITRNEADALLRRDVESFAIEVSRAVKANLSAAQFSALVSFCFNVGGTNFRRSSVLEAVNDGDFAAVPRRLALWTKAGGHVLPGLVLRRAAEAALFMSVNDVATQSPDRPVSGKPVRQSTTVAAAVVILAAAIAQAIRAGASDVVSIATAGVILACALWVIRERIRKIHKEGV